MCIFTGPVFFVGDTKIFARAEADEHQVLAYAMRVGAKEDLAMVLPLPVPADVREDAVTFIDLSGYAEFFEDLWNAFPKVAAPQSSRGLAVQKSVDAPATLTVHRVGEFEASFVPNLAAFRRLDERFRLADSIWDQIPQYHDWGFAVFKLRSQTSPRRRITSRLTGHDDNRTYHPMAFRFPRRDPSSVFFPTVHVHDGAVHPTASFSHALYLQANAAPPSKLWQSSLGPLGAHVDVARASSLVVPSQRGFVRRLGGELPNRDTFVSVV